MSAGQGELSYQGLHKWADFCPVIRDNRVVRGNDGRKLDHKALEALRLRAVDQVQQGAHPEDAAAALGLHRKTVYGWLKKYREGGWGALLARPVPGRPPWLGPLVLAVAFLPASAARHRRQ